MKSIVLYLFLAIWASSKVEAQNNDWWKTAVFYQIYPRSFKDSNNDGIGDLRGLIDKLEHLKNAGVTAAWLSPIYASPQVDAGYDISNFTDVNPEYGTLADFDELVAKAKSLGLKVVMDFVPNHSSDQCEWFKLSEQRAPGYENYYMWQDGVDGGPPNNWISVFKYSAWQWSEIRQQYYLHQFAVQQPDFNYRDPKLVQEMKDVLRFWLDRGVDGFRIDAIPHMFEDELLRDEPANGNPNFDPWEWESLDHIYTKDHPLTFDMVYQFRDLVDEYTATNGGETRVLMTEAYTTLENTMLYYGNETRDGAHFSFNFIMIDNLNKDSTAQDFIDQVNTWMTLMPAKYTPNWVLGNHDKHRVATRYGPENADGLNMFSAMLPGVMVTYNGEEIAMENGEVTWEQGQDPNACNAQPEDFDKYSRDFQRTPFHWDSTVNAGFNEGAETWLPVSSKYLTNNLADQSVEGVKSHFHIYQELMRLRQDPVLQTGAYQMAALATNVIGLARKIEGQPGYLLVYNKALEAVSVDVSSLVTAPTVTVVLPGLSSTRAVGDSLSTTSTWDLGAFEAFIVKEN